MTDLLNNDDSLVEIRVNMVEYFMVRAKLIDLDFRITKYKGNTPFQDKMGKVFTFVSVTINVVFII